MGFTSIGLYNFRNLKSGKIDTSYTTVYLVGENGQGKTNLLEAVYLLCFGSSFRTKNQRLLIRYGEKEMSLRGTFSPADGENGAGLGREAFDMELRLFTAAGSGKRKEIYVDGKRVQDRKELIRNVPCIVFSHDDIEFINGTPERKRWFLNQTMSMFNPLFIDTLRKYNRLVKMRNTELKEQSGAGLDIYDSQLAELGLEIVRLREKTVSEFNETFMEMYRIMQGGNDSDPVRIVYAPSWKGVDTAAEACRLLEERRETDREAGFTTSGPHRDRLVFTYLGRDFAQTASTGQLRLISLVLRSAQTRFFHEKAGREPVLLLDDVLLELDTERKRAFMEAMPAYEQAFFTFLPDEQFRKMYEGEETKVYTVENGEISE
jgi:DNA replication and repair protein RecF